MLKIIIIQIGRVKTRHVAKQQGVGLCLIVQSIADIYSGSSVKCRLRPGGGLIDFDDVSAAVDGFWSGCRGLSLICRLCHKSDIQSWH